jgi:GGDEF domain-containing protein
MEHELTRSLRYKRPLSVAVLVPDRPLDDKVRDCAILIRSRMRAPDFLGHLGRGVFAMVLPESQSAAAGAISSRIGTELCETTGVTFRSAAADVVRYGPKPDEILKQLLGEEQ